MMADIVVRTRALAGAEVVTSRAARRTLAVLFFAVLTALGAYVMVPIPGTPVPVTLQTMVVILSGVLLGARLGAASQLAYLAAGIAGAPVFTGGGAGPLHLMGLTGGYLLAFPVAAAVAGAVAGRARSRGVGRVRILAGLAAGAAVILAVGASQLAILTGDAANAIRLGITPFVAGDAVKILVALLVANRVRDRVLGRL